MRRKRTITSVPDIRKQIRRLESQCGNAWGAERQDLKREINRFKRSRPEFLHSEKGRKKLTELDNRVQRSLNRRKSRAENRPRPTYNDDLPIVAKRQDIIEAVSKNRVVVISGETGSGKTTQIPKFCLEAGRGIDGKIGCTQPRRIAAMTVASRIAEELGEDLGRSVGYKIRFQDQTGDDAFIKIMTDGILLAEAQNDRWLNEYDTIIVDEAHERSLNIDFVLGVLKDLVHRRKDLKLIITSATIDTEKFSKAFDDAPIIEVSGRMYPVEVRYTAPSSSNEDQTHVDLAVSAMDKLQQESPYGGDVLIFMPTEQDIRETCELLEGRNYTGVTVLPLFARLSAGDQSRVFSRVRGRKIIVSTNVAETSITIPGITYVIDTGLARISQYSPRSRTTSLPVLPVARSSADQRMGRCGRVSNGICIRLYEETDYETRPRFTPPEILRSNLAEVILRMIDLRLGDIAAFPFIDRPAEKNIQDGFNLLEELGAIHRKPSRNGKTLFGLTAHGRIMAKLPLDPRLSRMLLEAAEQGCLDEMTVIASALSLQDPRDRPAEKEAQADQAHAKFKDPNSDFLALLNIWNGYHETRQEVKSTGRMRKYCKENFISFRRMREWRDIHYQIRTILEEHNLKNRVERPSTKAKKGKSPFYEGLHRSVLSGFLSNIANKKEKNIYRAAKDREVMVFPGSGLFNQAGPWIVSAEMVETSRLFARMAADIEVDWLESVGRDQCRYTYFEPHWERSRGEVVAYEQVSLYGLIIVPRRTVSYGRIDPEEARDIFIRSALVEGDLRQPLPFMVHNRTLMEEVRTMEDRVRRRDLMVSEADLHAFYAERIDEGVYDIRTLKQLIKKRRGDRFLRLKREDLLRTTPDPEELALYPEQVTLGNTVFPCDYHFVPGDASDGVTVRIPSDQASTVPSESLDWLVPGLFREKITALIKALPKAHRKQLVPVSNTVDIIAAEMDQNRDTPLITRLGEFIHTRFGVDIPASAWSFDELPDYLKMRISVRGPKGEEIRAGRDATLLGGPVTHTLEEDRFQAAKAEWERDNITDWDFGDLPESVPLNPNGKRKWMAYPGLTAENGSISLRLYEDRNEALEAHVNGVSALLGRFLSREIRFLKKQLELPRNLMEPARYFGGNKILEQQMYDAVLKDLLQINLRNRKEFLQHAEKISPLLRKAGDEKSDRVGRVLNAYHQCRTILFDLENRNRTHPGMVRFLAHLRDDLSNLVPEHFVSLYNNDRLAHLERYIQAIALRAERGVVNLEKDQLKARDVQIQANQLKDLLNGLSPRVSDEKRWAVEDFFWLIEEYKVSLYAQELKTPVPVSQKRLNKRYEEIRRMA
ncbi:MAG: ATP-dependent RNA helicase HrpA [Thermodesulfobacteriota bacterium]